MFTYTKSLLAVAIAMIVVLGTLLWLTALSRKLESLDGRKKELFKARSIPEESAKLPELERKIKEYQKKIEDLERRFVGRKYDEAEKILELVNTATEVSKVMWDEFKPSVGEDQQIRVKLNVEGKYAGLVKFFQHLDSGELKPTVVSFLISALKPSNTDWQEEDKVEAKLILTIPSLGD